MTIFEFVLTPLALIIGFGITEILKGWGERVHHRNRSKSHVLQIASSSMILFFSLVYLWVMWLIRDIVWTFPLFLLIAIPGYAVALAAYINRVDCSADAPPILDQYFHNSRPLYGMLTLFLLSLITLSLLTGVATHAMNSLDVIAVTLQLSLLGVLVFLAWSKKLQHHLFAYSVLLIVLCGLSLRLWFLGRLVAG
jgi:hypothetical protein